MFQVLPLNLLFFHFVLYNPIFQGKLSFIPNVTFFYRYFFTKSWKLLTKYFSYIVHWLVGHLTSSSPALNWEVCHPLPWFSGFGIQLIYTSGFPGSPACRQLIIGLLSLLNCVSHFFIINLLLCVCVWIHIHIYVCECIYPIGSVSEDLKDMAWERNPDTFIFFLTAIQLTHHHLFKQQQWQQQTSFACYTPTLAFQNLQIWRHLDLFLGSHLYFIIQFWTTFLISVSLCFLIKKK